MVERRLQVGVMIAACSLALSPGTTSIPAGSRAERAVAGLQASGPDGGPAARPAAIPAEAWERMLGTIAADGYTVRPTAEEAGEEGPGHASSARGFTEESILRASDAQAGDELGAVAISGDTAVVGATGEDGGAGDPAANAGAAYVFGRDEGGSDNWGQVARLTASDAQAGDGFGASVAISGDTAIVGALREAGGAGDPLSVAGAAYVFQLFEGFGWLQIKKLTASDAQPFDFFGGHVAISGDTVVVGARQEDGGAGDPLPNAGAAYVFGRHEGGTNNWGQVVKLTAEAQAGDFFGTFVAISGDTVVVGATGEDGGAGDPLTDAGAAYVFEFVEGFGWLQIEKLTASDAQAGDGFGVSGAISADTAVVGALFENGGVGDPLTNAGAAYVFARDDGGSNSWGEVAKLTASDAHADDLFGTSVAITGDTAVVGAFQEDGGAGDPLADAGAAYVFGRDEGGSNNWGQATKLTASDAQAGDQFGISVAITGDAAVVGAWRENGGAGDPLTDAGAAYVFRESFLRFFIGGRHHPIAAPNRLATPF